jgi:hypothetical protein
MCSQPGMERSAFLVREWQRPQLLQWMQSHCVAVTCAHKAQLATNEANSTA